MNETTKINEAGPNGNVSWMGTDGKGKRWEDYDTIKCPNGQVIDMNKLLDEQQREFKLPSEEFVSWAFSSYQRFVNNLYIICLENGFNLEEIQVKYSLPISYSWDWKDADYIVSQEEFDAMCSKLKRPFKAKNGDKSIFISQLDDKELYRIHRELQDKGYIKGSVNAFISAMRDEEADFPLKWIKLSTKRKDTSLASLHNFLHLMGCKKKQAERIALIYFGEKFHRNTTYNSEYNTELQKIVKGMKQLAYHIYPLYYYISFS